MPLRLLFFFLPEVSWRAVAVESGSWESESQALSHQGFFGVAVEQEFAVADFRHLAPVAVAASGPNWNCICKFFRFFEVIRTGQRHSRLDGVCVSQRHSQIPVAVFVLVFVFAIGLTILILFVAKLTSPYSSSSKWSKTAFSSAAVQCHSPCAVPQAQLQGGQKRVQFFQSCVEALHLRLLRTEPPDDAAHSLSNGQSLALGVAGLVT